MPKTPTRLVNVVANNGLCSRASLPAGNKAVLRQLARELQKQGKLPRSMNVTRASPTALCNKLHSIHAPPSWWKRALGGLVLATAVGGLAGGAGTVARGNRGAPAVVSLNNAPIRNRSVNWPTPLVRQLNQLGSSSSTALPRVRHYLGKFAKGPVNCTVGKCLNSYAGMHQAGMQHVARVIAKNPNLTASGDSFGLAPGTHIYYKGAFKVKALTHHGVYLGEGMVVDVGSVPDACMSARNTMARNTGQAYQFKSQGIGLSKLTNFVKRGFSTYYVTYETQRPRADILYSALDHIGPNKYNVLRNNCEHLATELVTGKRTSRQAMMAFLTARHTLLGAAAGAAVYGAGVGAAVVASRSRKKQKQRRRRV